MRRSQFKVQGSKFRVTACLLALLLPSAAFAQANDSGASGGKAIPTPAARDLTSGWWLKVPNMVFNTGTAAQSSSPVRFNTDGTYAYYDNRVASEHYVSVWQTLPDGDVVIASRRHRWHSDQVLVSTDSQQAFVAMPPLNWPTYNYDGGKTVKFIPPAPGHPGSDGGKTYAPLIAARKGYDVAALRAREQYERAMEKAKADYLSNLRVVEASAARESNAAGVKEVAEEKGRVEGERYIYFSSPVTWSAAKSICEALGGRLVTVESKEKGELILRLTGGQGTWLNASRTRAGWKWGTGEALSYTQWAEGQPDNQKKRENVAVMWSDGNWHDLHPDALKPFVCEWPAAVN